jgi:cytochrome c oxidase subunit 2
VRVRITVTLCALFLTACSAYGAPSGATEQGRAISGLWRVFAVAGLAVGAIVSALILWSLIRYRRRGDGRSAQFRDNLPLEITYTVIPIVIVTALFVLTFRVENRVVGLPDPGAPEAPVATIEVTAFDWSWRFDYGNGVVVSGTPDDPPEMVVPAGQPVRIVLTSEDVVHSFYIPDFLFKRDATPGLVQRFDLLVDREGRYSGQCAEFCGLDHARMTFTLRAVSPAEFTAWLAAEAGG